MTKYPSLYAALEPDEVNGRRGFTVRCTATRRAIGFIWWTVTGGTAVTWHWRTGDHFGERNTERNAVQALRDVSNLAGRLPFSGVDDTPVPSVRRSAPVTTPATPAPAPAARRIVWADEPADLNAAIASAFAKGRKS